MKIYELIKKIYDEIEELQSKVGCSKDNFTYCFRGESRDYGDTSLTPTLFREEKFKGFLPDKEIISLISDYNVAEKEHISSLSKAIEGQHFLELSRLLDVTFNILPSIYFASSTSMENNGYIYIFQFPKTYSPSSVYINNFFEQLIEGEIIPYYQNFKVLSHTQSNDRIKLQSGGFILFPGVKMKKIPDLYYKRVEIEANDKMGILEDLNMYFNINESTIYPEKDKKKNLIRNKFNLTNKCSLWEKERTDLYKIEIDEALNRINHELGILIENQIQPNLEPSIDKDEVKKKLKRYLRKEKKDLLGYIKDIGNELNEKDFLTNQEDKINREFYKWSVKIEGTR